MSNKHSIIVKLTNQSRLFIADSVNSSAERNNPSDENKKIKYSPTTKTRIPLPAQTEVGEQHRLSAVPVINANMFRGRLRRNIADRLIESLRERGQGVSVDTIHLMTCLAASASPSSAKIVANAMKSDDPAKFFKSKEADAQGDEYKSTDYRTEYLATQTSDPFVALFGGGPNMWKSRLVTPDLLPHITELQQPYIINSKYQDAFDSDPISVHPSYLTELVGSVRNDDIFRNTDYQNVDAEEMETWVAIEKDNENKEEGKTNLRNMMTVEVVRTGTPFIGEIFVKNEDVSESTFSIMKGLIYLALEDIKHQQLGGMVRNGWGQVDVEIAGGADSDSIEAAQTYIKNFSAKSMMEAFGVAFR